MKAMGKLMENKNVGKYDFYDQKFHYRTYFSFVFDRRGAVAQSEAICIKASKFVLGKFYRFFSAPPRLCGHQKNVYGSETKNSTKE